MSHPDVLIDGAGLTCAEVRRVAQDRASVQVDAAGLARAAAAHALVKELAARRPVYGRTTGVGANRLVTVAPEPGSDASAGDAHGLRLLRSHAAGAGPLLDPVIARAMLVVRLNQLAAGGSGVGPEVLTALAEALNRGLAPTAYTFGAIGTGDLSALASAALCLLGELPWRGGQVPAVQFDPADAVGFVSSNAALIGEAALACANLSDLFGAATVISALAFLGADGNIEAYDEFVQRARPHPGQQAVAASLRRLLRGQPTRSARIQDPYSYRAMPQVHGSAVDAAAALDRTLAVELNAAGENPLVDVAGSRILHNANFHMAHLGLALDSLRIGLYQTAALSVARTTTMLEPAITGLTPFLAAGPAGSSGLMILEYVAQSALADLRHCATPATLASAVVSRGVEEHAPFSAQAARNTTQAVAAYRVILSVELVAAIRALRMRGTAPAPGLARDAFDLAAAVLPEPTTDRNLDADLRAAADLLATYPGISPL
ncbi:aromatic amino acid ammonia-lyase [Phytohabitans rumicis]|uniref:Histidine ammonia-lyase n=1 Tax=Phytohabitans rumicis TaxID=1076125 RepID=A0A6V8L2P5_9ACTN|nr:aromatic amino acid ammonia-lyase [Phytohabitans rumicis]GFJ86975.1 histidine ammonia-lyase [Phytohabitans rumicis]